jgi:hypothetical protein
LDWSEISTETPITTAPGIQVSSVSWWSKTLFLDSLLVFSFPTAFASLSYFTALARKSECGTFDLIEFGAFFSQGLMEKSKEKLESSRTLMEERESEHKSVLVGLNELGGEEDHCEGREEV